MDLDDALLTIIQADQQTVDVMEEGPAKREVIRVRRLYEEMKKEQEKEEEHPKLGYANNLHNCDPEEHRSRSDPFTDNEKTSNWILGTLETALARTDLTPDQLQAVVDEAVRRHKEGE